ncbi:MAG: RNA-binding protein, partial [Candidatus Bathyarchaeia archaeon]
DKIRYVDLEIDVVRRLGEKPQIVDSHELDRAVEYGHISDKLAQNAKETARKLIVELSED